MMFYQLKLMTNDNKASLELQVKLGVFVQEDWNFPPP